MIWLLRILLWLVMLAVSALVAVSGLAIVPLLAALHAWRASLNPNGCPIWVWPDWFFLWSNSEDGICDMSPPTFWRTVYWNAVRNKGNLRFIEPFGFTVNPRLVSFHCNNHNLYLPLPATGRFFWSLTWQGLYSGFWFVWRGVIQLRIGWTLVPDDLMQYNPQDLRQRFCGFSFQLNKPGV